MRRGRARDWNLNERDRMFAVSENCSAAYDRWNPVIKGRYNGKDNDPATEPTAEMTVLMDAVGRALAANKHYSCDVLAYVLADMAGRIVGDVEKGKGPGGVEGGVFGMDVYYARGAIDARRERAENAAALQRIVVGQEFGTLKIGGKRTCHCTVTAIRGYTVELSASRGRATYRVETSPVALLRMAGELA